MHFFLLIITKALSTHNCTCTLARFDDSCHFLRHKMCFSICDYQNHLTTSSHNYSTETSLLGNSHHGAHSADNHGYLVVSDNVYLTSHSYMMVSVSMPQLPQLHCKFLKASSMPALRNALHTREMCAD